MSIAAGSQAKTPVNATKRKLMNIQHCETCGIIAANNALFLKEEIQYPLFFRSIAECIDISDTQSAFDDSTKQRNTQQHQARRAI
jgi:hypothetical protein